MGEEEDDVTFIRSLYTWEFALFVSVGTGVIVFGHILFDPNHWVFFAGVAAGVFLDLLDDVLTSHAEDRLSGEEDDPE